MTWGLWGHDRTAAVVPGSTIFRGIDLSDFPDDLVSRAHRAIDGTADLHLHDDLLNHIGDNHGFSGWWTDDPDNARHYAAGGHHDDNPLRAILATDWNGEGQDYDYTDDEVGEDDVPLRDEPPRPHTVLVNRPGSGWINISHHTHTASRTAMPIYYHVAPVQSRDSILQHGLNHTRGESPYGHPTDANYFWENPDDAADYAHKMTEDARDDDEHHPGYTVLPFTHDGPVKIDPESQYDDRGRSFYTTDPIPPTAFHTASRTASTTLYRGMGLSFADGSDRDHYPRFLELYRQHKKNPNDPVVGDALAQHLDEQHRWPGTSWGRHWTPDREIAENFAYCNGGLFNTLATAEWDGQGEDLEGFGRGGHHPNEQEITLHPGTGLHLTNFEVGSLDGPWHDVLRNPRHILAKQSHTASRTAMPAIDAYDKDFPIDERREHPRNQQSGPWFHGSDHDLPNGTILVPGKATKWQQIYDNPNMSSRANWVWFTPGINHAATYGQHVYEVEPLDEGPWPWNDHRGQHVSPRARIIRKVDPYKEAKLMTAAVTVYTKPNCPQCNATHKHLTNLGIDHDTVDVTQDPEAHAYVTGLGYQAAPVVVVNDGEDHWSGYRPDRLKGLAE